MKNVRFFKTLTAGFALTLVICSQVLASTVKPCGQETGDITSGTSANCWQCGGTCYARLSDGKMTIAGSGSMYDYSSEKVNGAWASTAPWRNAMSKIKSVEIGDEITSVGNRTFLSAMNLESVKIGSSVETIGSASFYMDGVYKDVVKLNNITIPASVTEIKDQAFAGARALSSVNFESNEILESIGYRAFEYANLSSINIPDSVESIGYGAFWSNYNLTNIHLPASLTSLGDKVFEYANLETLEFPEGITYIPDRTCAYCSNLKKVVVKGDNISIYYNAFNGTGVTDVESSETVKNILLSYFSSQLGRNVTWTEYFEQKPKRLYYTPAEAAAHVNHSNHNRVIFTFK